MKQHTDHFFGGELPPKETILVVEDDLSMGVKIVQAISYEMPYAALLLSESVALEVVLKQIQPELIIVEEHMVTVNGILPSFQLHPLEGLRDIPLLMVCTELPQTELVKGKIAHVRKPFNLDGLLLIIKQILRSQLATLICISGEDEACS
jgi:CheY-like chemotaxis protein